MEDCTVERCVSACGFERFERWLDAPLTDWDRRDEELRESRLQALWRGEIPA